MPRYDAAHGNDASMRRLAAYLALSLEDVDAAVRRDLSAIRAGL